MGDRLALRVALGQHQHVQPLKDGRVVSQRIDFNFAEFEPLPKAFRQMVRVGDLDVCEMALTTHLLAHHYGKPITALAVPLWSRLHHGNLVCPSDSALKGAGDLKGRKVGVRAYTQTTGVWIRGILSAEYGVPSGSVTWVTMEDAHVAEYADPPFTERDRTGKGLRQLMQEGELAAIMGERNADPQGVRPVIADADRVAKDWSRRTGVLPVNHIVSVKTELLRQHPWLAQELIELFEAARRMAGEAKTDAPPPHGLEPNRRSMQMLLDFALDQQLVPRPYRVDELFWREAK
jgi:4,5-dihydroxyphthalate decarboxylase